MHGARSRRGPEHPGFRHGVYSRFLPTRIRSLAKQIAEDPNLADVRQDIARLTSLLLVRLRDADLSGGLKLNDQSAILALTAARLQAIDRRQRQAEFEAETITREQYGWMLDQVVEVLRAHVGDEILLKVQRDLRARLESKRFAGLV
jgi:hypothetical protein